MAKRDEPKEWWEEFGYMTPQEQQWVMAEHGLPYTPANAEPTSYDYTDEEALMGYPLAGVAATPEYTSKGALDPRDLSQVAKGINVAQDYGALLLDNILSGLSGPGSYDAGAFTPQVEYGKELRMAGREQLADLAGKGGWEGYIADKMLNENMSSSQAMAALEADVAGLDPNDPELPPNVKAVIRSLPKVRATGANAVAQQIAGGPGGLGGGGDEADFWSTYDYDRIYSRANELQDKVYEDEIAGYEEVDAQGRTHYYDAPPEVIKTPQMEFFDKYGLPYPTASYNEPRYVEQMLNAEEGTTPEYRQAEAADYEDQYNRIIGQTRQAEQAYETQGDLEDQMLKAWEAAQPKPLATRPGTTTVPGRAGIEYGQERRVSPNAPGAATIMPTAEQMMLPTTVLQPGRQLANPTPGTNPRTGIGAGNTWAYTNDQGQMFATNPNQPTSPLQVRTLANGLMGLVGGGAAPQPGEGRGFGVLAPGQTSKDPLFSAFTAPKGSKTRSLTGSDVDQKARTNRAVAANDRAVAARQRQRDVENNDPRLNDIKAAAQLYWLAKAGRTPLQDAIGQRRAGASRLGL